MNQPDITILLVDDDVALRTAFARALERAGYATITSAGDSTVIDLITQHVPSLVLLDNHMPGTTGIELIGEIRQLWSHTDLPVILVSGSSDPDEIDEALRAGANDFRRKPVELADLLATVDTTLQACGQPQNQRQGVAR